MSLRSGKLSKCVYTRYAESCDCVQTDLIPTPAALAEVQSALTAINSGAEILLTSHSQPELARILNRGAFNPSQGPDDVSHLNLQLEGAQIGISRFSQPPPCGTVTGG